MSWDNRVLWLEGLFLQPHHFQQHDRWIERLTHAQAGIGTPYPWGLSRLVIDRELLEIGRIAITDCAGILPDGTPFDAPGRDPLPPPLELDESATGQTVFLCLPLRRSGEPESGGPDATDAMLRLRAAELRVRDNTVGAGTEAPMEVGRLDLRLRFERDIRDGFACCGLARVLECRADRRVVLDSDYIPPSTDYRAGGRLANFVEELEGLVHRQAEARAGQVRGVGQGGVSDWADFLLLQVLNRAEPLIVHLKQVTGLHPETLYQTLLGLAGELATFASDTKRPPDFPPYRQNDLDATFSPLITTLRDYLSREIVQRAIPIEIKERQYGFRIALVPDTSMLTSARFVLAARAQMDSGLLRSRLPSQTKIAALDKIQELVRLALPGIPLRPLPTPPLEIPYHAGYDYFELDRQNELWTELAGSPGFGLHIGGEFPALDLELWAIRE